VSSPAYTTTTGTLFSDWNTTSTSVFVILGRKLRWLAASRAAPWWVTVSMRRAEVRKKDRTDGRTDGRQTVTLRLPEDAASAKWVFDRDLPRHRTALGWRQCPRNNTRLGDKSFSVAGPKVWNNMEQYVYNKLTYSCFATLRQPDVELG